MRQNPVLGVTGLQFQTSSTSNPQDMVNNLSTSTRLFPFVCLDPGGAKSGEGKVGPKIINSCPYLHDFSLTTIFYPCPLGLGNDYVLFFESTKKKKRG